MKLTQKQREILKWAVTFGGEFYATTQDVKAACKRLAARGLMTCESTTPYMHTYQATDAGRAALKEAEAQKP